METDMTVHTHQTVPTQYVEANGIRFAYRRFGNAAGVPLVLNQHFTGTMDHWDPAMTDALSKDREVILFNNVGVSSTSGEQPETVDEMATHAIAFIRALGLEKVDVLGYSLGGFVAQEIAVQAPSLVRKLILVGTGPRGGTGMESLSPEAQAIFALSYDTPEEVWVKIHFHTTETSQAAGREWLERMRRRTVDRDPDVSDKVAPAQAQAVANWGEQRDGAFDYLKGIYQPTLVVNGGNDIIVYTVNSFILQQNLPDAQLILYPDSGHGSQFQYPELFAQHVSMFLEA
jgi:pimeloyl-ACP methyl ester carboxylesterase